MISPDKKSNQRNRIPRLPPWEVFQRGPVQNKLQTQTPGPHQKTFTGADICKLFLNDSLWYFHTGHYHIEQCKLTDTISRNLI